MEKDFFNGYNILIDLKQGKDMQSYLNMKQAYKKLKLLKAGALFMQIGSQKIKTALSLAKYVEKEIDFVVWIAPASFLATKWYQEDIKKNLGKLEKRIYFFSIEGLSVSDSKYLQLYKLADEYKTLCVVDESITIKNTEAGRTRRLLSMRNKFSYRLILSGTPLTQGLIDMYSQIQFMDSDILKMTESQFMNVFIPFMENDKDTWRRWSTPEHEAKLIEIMRPYIMGFDFSSRYKPKHYNFYFDLTPLETKSYHLEKEKFLEGRHRVDFLQIVQKFQYFYTISKNKVDKLFEVVKEIIDRKEKVIIYIKFKSEIKFFKESGLFKGLHYVAMTSLSDKKRVLEKFEKSADIMFCTYKVEAPHLNTNGCNNIIYFTQTFDYKDKLQCLYHLYNVNGKKEVNIYNFWVKTGLEKLIEDNLNRKENSLSNVCRFISKEGALRL